MYYTHIIKSKGDENVNWTLPGTVLSVDLDREESAEEVFSAMFLTGGLVLSQVTQVTGLEPYIVQNWVRRGFLSPPQQRKYTRRQLSRILTINALKSALSIDQICSLLRYINGALDDEGDDTIDDTQFYRAFVLLARTVTREGYPAPEELGPMLDRSLAAYEEPVPGAKQRIKAVLRILITAWRSAQLQSEAQRMLLELP
ncbi:MAG: DUF1836 domain-containing protein [Clostridia bacterium]|nr:DUF1836 domain-containing protein [Clostridia bacterium]